jgi:hypothetical protein
LLREVLGRTRISSKNCKVNLLRFSRQSQNLMGQPYAAPVAHRQSADRP